MAIFAEVTETSGIHPLLDYDASGSQSMISIEIGLSALYGFSVRT